MLYSSQWPLERSIMGPMEKKTTLEKKTCVGLTRVAKQEKAFWYISYIPAPPKGCLLLGFMKLKTSKEHPTLGVLVKDKWIKNAWTSRSTDSTDSHLNRPVGHMVVFSSFSAVRNEADSVGEAVLKRRGSQVLSLPKKKVNPGVSRTGLSCCSWFLSTSTKQPAPKPLDLGVCFVQNIRPGVVTSSENVDFFSESPLLARALLAKLS